MLKQLWEVAATVVVASYRKNILVASWLIMLPLLLAAWLFEVHNPGFQTGFIIDAGSSLMSILSVILLVILGFEHIFWAQEQSSSWFFFCRLKSKVLLPAGKFLGISLVCLFSLLVFALLLFLLVGFTTEVWLVLPFKIAFMVWAEYSLLLSLLVLFSVFFSRMMSMGLMIPLFFIAHSAEYIKHFLPNAVAEIVLAFIPNVEIFGSVIENGGWAAFLLALLYSWLMSSFYIILSGARLRSMDL